MAKMVLPNLRTHVHLYSNTQMLMHGGGLDSLAIPKAPGATVGFMATPRAVKQEQVVKEEQAHSSQTTITSAFTKAATHAPNIDKRPREEDTGPMKKRPRQGHTTDAVAMVADMLQCRHKVATHLLDDANGDVTAAINLGIAQDQSEGRVHQQIKADHIAAQQDSPQKTKEAALGVIDLTDSPMQTPQEDTECLYMGTKQPT